MKTVFFLYAGLLIASFASAQADGPRSGASFNIGLIPGSSMTPTFAKGVQYNDSLYSGCGNIPGAAGNYTDYMIVTNFSFNIAANATISGIVVNVERNDPNSKTSDYSIRIIKGGVIGETDRSTGAPFPALQSYNTYGGPKDKWGQTWTVADINSSGFGVAFAAQRSSTGGISAGQVNHIEVTVYYNFFTLPVQLINFTALKNNSNRTTKLQWNVTNETNMDHYEVERSADGRTFHSISNISGRNQNSNNSYSSTDNNPPIGVSYYRLKMVGMAGEEKYSKILSVDFRSDQFSLYPTVLGQGENLYVTNSNNIPLQISFYNTSGKMVATTTSSSNQLSTDKLQALKGIFIYKVVSSDMQQIGTGKIIIQ